MKQYVRYGSKCEKCNSTQTVRYKFHWFCPKHKAEFMKKEGS